MDFYSKLRPDTDIEQCGCSSVTGLVLVYLFTPNPIHCLACRNAVDPERLGLGVAEIESIASCFAVNGSLYRLWLDSAEYEGFAKARLIDPRGQVNQEGRAIALRLSNQWPSYYWWFSDPVDDIPDRCPSCGNLLESHIPWGSAKCEGCRIIL